MTIQNHRRSDPDRHTLRLFAVMIAAVMMLSSAGCLTPELVPLEESSSVTRAVARRDLGIDYLSSHRTAMAIRELNAAMLLDPFDPQTHLWLGESYRRKGRTEEAEAFLIEAIRLSGDPEDLTVQQSARLTISALLSQMGRYEDSLEHCEALAEDATFSTPWRPLTNCGWALFQLGRMNEAEEHFSDALDFFPRYGPALLNFGILRAKEGHPLAAIKMLERALDSRRLSASALGEAHFRLGEIYIRLGRRDKAIEHFQEATTKAPYEDWGTESQAYLDLLH